MERCQEHAGHEARIMHNEQTNKEQWQEINSMKKLAVTMMGGLIIELIVVIITAMYIIASGGGFK